MPLPPSLYSHPPEPEEALRRSEQRLLLALESGHMGTWDWNIQSDRERVLARIEESITSRRDYSVEYRIVRPEGALRWIEARC